MKSFRTTVSAFGCALLLLTAFHAQSPAGQNIPRNSMRGNRLPMPRVFQGFRIAPSAQLRFLASEEGRRFLQATGHPLAKYAIEAFGKPAETTVIPQRWERQWAAPQQPSSDVTAAATVPCTGSSGARFNLEPRANALPQNQASADFIPNRLGSGDDLIVQGANDWRGNVKQAHWDQSVSGYYVHSSKTPDCSVQFEGGLPSFTFQGNTEMGIGNAVVAADPDRDTFFMADVRFANTGGVGLFRADASTLLNPTACPNGTHLQAQAASCWMVTPPVLLFPAPSFDSVGDMPSIAVDERATGTGASDVYVAEVFFSFSTQSSAVFVTACTNSLNCGTGTGVKISGADNSVGFPYVRVRADGMITVSYVNANTDGSIDIKFATCIASGAPKAPVCSVPTVVKHVAQPIAPNTTVTTELVNINLLAFTFPKHASRAESGGKFTTFLVYDDCRNPFAQGNPPFTVCMDAEVLMTTSKDNGKTWSTPVSVNTAAGHHFYPAISTDPSTGITNIVYYSTEGDKFNHEVRVFRNTITPGGTSVAAPQAVTTVLDPIDGDPDGLGALQSDAYMGAVTRGNLVSGQSRLYISFDSTVVTGVYAGRTAPELNNHILVVSF
jgi:hypothetical protein